MMVKTSTAMVAEDSARPGMSGAAACGSFEVGTTSAATIAAAAATGAMAVKILAQLNCSSSQPPTIGPVAMATPAIPPHQPMAPGRSPPPAQTVEVNHSLARH